LWGKNKETPPPKKWHFDNMQEAIGEPLVRGGMGIDVGAGCGYDTYIMAKNNPGVRIVSIDLSDGVYKTRGLTSSLRNVKVVQCSTSGIPMRDGIFDFAYSFGVLHHTNNPQRGLLEIARILKRESPAFVYLYEDHSENTAKHIAVRIVDKIRSITTKIPPRGLYVLSCIFSPFIFIVFTVPSKILRKFRATQKIADKIPFNFGTGPFSLGGDIYDRFSAPIEHRFSRQEVYDIFTKSGFKNIGITRIKDRAGWVAWGYKK